MGRKITCDTDLPKIIQYFAYEYVAIYRAVIHSSTKESSDYLWYGIRRSIRDFKVWGYHIEALHMDYIGKSRDRTEIGYFIETAGSNVNRPPT